MNKTEFLQALASGLAKATPDERVAAMQYYSEYLDEAGPQREAEVLAELGSPERLAADILGGGDGFSPPARGEAPAETPPASSAPAAAGPELTLNPTPQPPKEDAAPTAQAPQWEAASPPTGGQPFNTEAPQAPPPPPGWQSGQPVYDSQPPAGGNSALKIALVVVGLVLLFPGIIGLLGGIIGVLAGVAVVPFALGIGLAAGGIACFVASILLVGASVGNGLLVMGLSFILLGLGLLFFFAGIQLVGKAIPKLVRAIAGGIRGLWRKLFPKREAG